VAGLATVVAAVDTVVRPIPLRLSDSLIAGIEIADLNTILDIRRVRAGVRMHLMIAVRLGVSVDVKVRQLILHGLPDTR
jgi:hypothetical protein